MHSALSQYEELFFYVDNTLMIISWKKDVGSIQMQNIILYVVAVGSSPTPFLHFFLDSLSIGYQLKKQKKNIGYQCHNMMLS